MADISQPSGATSQQWDAAQYNKFERERAQPFYDLVELARFRPNMEIVDLGCGNGALTRELKKRLPDATLLGIDASPAMLSAGAASADPALRFVNDKLENIGNYGTFDLIFSNAALHWVPDHEQLFAALTAQLRPGGQLLIQMPDNNTHPSHALIHALAKEEPYASALKGFCNHSHVQTAEFYSALLHRLGFDEKKVQLRVYGHELQSSASTVEWVKGSVLTAYKERLPAGMYQQFIDEYRKRFIAAVGGQQPYFYTFRRILIWGQR